ncbi:MAG: magnesium Mg(2+) and cobalt Co(2+) transport protein CorA [Eubacterium sp.]|nr:magnesium Mg(2+) and cobalt Co(2+) transport protein CorA [Eubacterium sp.]
MPKLVKSRSGTIGLPPGSLVHIGEKKRDTTLITLIGYDEDNYEERKLEAMELKSFNKRENGVQWLNIEGLSDVDTLGKIGEMFNLHPLILEDILNTDQRPKIDINDEYIYISSKMLSYNSEVNEFDVEQVSFVLGKNYVLSISEKDTDVFEPVIHRLKQGMSRIRKLGADYLVYCLLDVIVDNYFAVLEGFGEKIEVVEDEMVIRTNRQTLGTIHDLKRQILFLHKAVWPLREVLSFLERGESLLVQEATGIYIRDLYDHVIQVMDTTETLRDILSSMLDVYLSSTSNRMNEIMKVLTIISTVFMPLSFIVGVYGMNIKNMPELNWPWMYPALWLVMISISVFMLIYFKKRKWW